MNRCTEIMLIFRVPTAQEGYAVTLHEKNTKIGGKLGLLQERGSVNPGGGKPMVVLCGQNVSKKVVAWERR